MSQLKQLISTIALLSGLVLVFCLSSLAASANGLSYVKVRVLEVTDRAIEPGRSNYWKDQVIGAQQIAFGIIPVIVCSSKSTNQNAFESQLRMQSDEFLRQQIRHLRGTARNYCSEITNHPKTVFDTDLIVPIEMPSFERSLRELVSANSNDSEYIVIFAHGCCIDSAKGLRQAAELQELFRVPTISFDWATHSQPIVSLRGTTYSRSERALELSEFYFNSLVDKVLELYPTKKLILIGHSMGCRLIERYLWLAQQRLNPAKIHEVHMIRADISLPAFISKECGICSVVHNIYLYHANNDRWLALSRFIGRGVPRGGNQKQFFEQCTTAGKDFSVPNNRFFLDISSIGAQHFSFHHDIPFDLVRAVHEQGPDVSIDGFRAIPETGKWNGNLFKIESLATH